MITKEIAQYHIERHIDFGEELPPEVEHFLDHHPESRMYLNKMLIVADTLRQIEIQPAPAMLVDEIMNTIRTREMVKQRSWSYSVFNPFINFYSGTLNFVHEFRVDPVLSREAWPTVFATLSILFGVFILPQVESGKTDQLRTAVESKVIAITDETYQKVEDVAKQISDFAAGIIRSVSGEPAEEKKEPGDGLGLKYDLPVHRTLWQDAAQQA